MGIKNRESVISPMRLFLCCLTLAFLWASPHAHAHNVQRSSSHWQITEEGAHLLFSMPEQDLRDAFPNLSQAPDIMLSNAMPDLFRFSERGESCASRPPVSLSASPDLLKISMRFQCRRPITKETPLSIATNLFFEQVPAHLHFLRISFEDAPSQEYVLSTAQREIDLPPRTEARQSGSVLGIVFLYLPIGIEHILVGLDHLAFLAALLLLAATPRRAVLAITGFTLGHSLTLGLAATGRLSAHVPLIEALIGFTIFIAAMEFIALQKAIHFKKIFLAIACFLLFLGVLSLLLPSVGSPALFAGLIIFTLAYGMRPLQPNRGAREIPWLAAIFGLIHGFGFAAILQEFDLPLAQLLWALLGFNLGVEIGQIFVVLMVFLGVGACLRLPAFYQRRFIVAELSAMILTSVGLYWFVSRLFA